MSEMLPLTTETVRCFLYTLLRDLRRRGSMFPQTEDEQVKDSQAVHRVLNLLKDEETFCERMSSEILELSKMRSQNKKFQEES